MNEKRANNGIWKIATHESETSEKRISAIVTAYNKSAKIEGNAPLREIQVAQTLDDASIRVYIRIRQGLGIYSFLAEHLIDESDRDKFRFRAVDACIFIVIDRSSIFAVTTGSGYRVLEDHVDYAFPFEIAKKVLANNFRAADVRQITGITTSKVEVYRRGQSISNSESAGKVWKRLVGRLNSDLIVEGSYLDKLIDPSRPPTLEVKSSLVLKKSLDLRQVTKLVRALEDLPDINEEQRIEFSFLDNLHQVKSKSLAEDLDKELVEALRCHVVDANNLEDLEVCDSDVASYYGGSRYQLGYWALEGDPPDLESICNLISDKFSSDIQKDSKLFFAKIRSLYIRYHEGEDSESAMRRQPLIKCLHGQICHKNEVYFCLDKIWYQVRGDFLVNLEKDFIQETFHHDRPILIEPNFDILPWKTGEDEGSFNLRQAKKPGFYYGDKVFAKTTRGKVELFDLLYVDHDDKRLYVIHAKDGFDAKMRDACSQIAMSAEIIEHDIASSGPVLASYFREWRSSQSRIKKRVQQSDFLQWFKQYSRTYLVLASTGPPFTEKSFKKGVFKSHIARREIIAVRNEFRYSDRVFQLVHTGKE